MSREFPAFLFYPEDFEAGTSEMTNAEVGMYMRLLCHQWHKGFVPNDPDRIASITRSKPGEMETSWPHVLPKFKDCGKGQLKNQRLEKIRAELKKLKRVRSASGKAGAAARWHGDRSDGYEDGGSMPNASESDGKKVSSRVGNADGDVNSQTQEKGVGPTTLQLPPILENQPFRDEFAHWLAFKKERREGYKPAGMSAVISVAAKRAQEHGLQAVIDAMQTARANGWQGWDQKSSFANKKSNDPRGTFSAAQEFLNGK